MKKIGTITTAIGFIYYGIWLIVKNLNSTYGENLFKWWPIIFIILGIEILVSGRYKEENKKRGFNIGVIFVICIFAITNIYSGAFNVVKNISNGNFEFNFDNNFKSVATSKEITVSNNKFKFVTSNGDITIKKSEDNKVKLDLNVKVNNNINKYNINESLEDGIDTVKIDENYVKEVKGTIYIPKDLDVDLDLNNCNLNNEDDLSSDTLNVKSNNSKFQMDKIKAINIDTNNSDINLSDIENIKIDGENIKSDLNGNIDNIGIDMNNGVVNVHNNEFKTVEIKGDNAVVNMNTKESNINASLTTNMGEIKFNEDRQNKGTMTKKTGTGENNLNIEVKLGSISVNSQE